MSDQGKKTEAAMTDIDRKIHAAIMANDYQALYDIGTALSAAEAALAKVTGERDAQIAALTEERDEARSHADACTRVELDLGAICEDALNRAESAERERECLRAVGLLVAQEDIFLSPPNGCVFLRYEGDKPTPEGFAVSSWNVGDTFAFACADSEPFALEEAPAMLALACKEGWPGIVRWCAERRKARGDNAEPIPPVKKQMMEIDKQRERAESAEARASALEVALREITGCEKGYQLPKCRCHGIAQKIVSDIDRALSPGAERGTS